MGGEDMDVDAVGIDLGGQFSCLTTLFACVY